MCKQGVSYLANFRHWEKNNACFFFLRDRELLCGTRNEILSFKKKKKKKKTTWKPKCTKIK